MCHVVQAGAITGFVSAFAEGPIDFFKSQIQVQIIRSKSDPNYKRATSPPACCMTHLLPTACWQLCLILQLAEVLLSSCNMAQRPEAVTAGRPMTQHGCQMLKYVTSYDAALRLPLRVAAAFTTVSGAVRSALTNNGIRGPFQGLGPTILRNTPANSIYLGSFEVLKQQFAEYKGCE